MTIHELIVRTGDMLFGRFDGPLTFRLILQPLMAAILAIRAGMRDAREGRTPYLWSIFTEPAQRREMLHHGWKDVRRVFFLAIVLDVIYEVIVFHWVYPGQVLLVAAVLAILPYLLIRGPATRFMLRLHAHGKPKTP